jgi:hypothetical protein
MQYEVHFHKSQFQKYVADGSIWLRFPACWQIILPQPPTSSQASRSGVLNSHSPVTPTVTHFIALRTTGRFLPRSVSHAYFTLTIILLDVMVLFFALKPVNYAAF